TSSSLRFRSRLLKIKVAQKKVKKAFENADSSSRVELIPSKIKYANKVVLSFHKEFAVFSSLSRKGNDGLLQDQVFKNKEEERDDLLEKVATLESATTSKEAELASLSSQGTKLTADLSGFQLSHDELNFKMASLKFKRDCLATQKNSLKAAFKTFKERIEALQDDQAKALGDRDGLKVGTNHKKARRDLSVVKAYDPSAEGKYVDAVNALSAIDFSLLSELESKKDTEDDVVFSKTSLSSSLKIISLRVQRFREEAKEKRLSLTDVMTLFIEPLSSKSLTGEANTSAAPITTLLTTFASFVIIPPNQALDAEPHGEDPPLVTFDKEELSTSPE
nr:hypothetical protein [Tanacetum cinerariifolium]